MPPAELAQGIQIELSKQKEDLEKGFQADLQGQTLSSEQLLKRALEYAFGVAASSAVGQLAAQTPAAPQPPQPATAPAPARVPPTPTPP